jgi:hypothetical protein
VRTSELADESADGFAHRQRNEVQLTGLGRRRLIAGFALSRNCRFQLSTEDDGWRARPSIVRRMTTSGSTTMWDCRFQSFKINDLKMVAQIFPRWNRLAEWLSRVRHFENAA